MSARTRSPLYEVPTPRLLTAGELQALQVMLNDLSTIETHAQRVNTLVSLHKLPLAWLIISERTAPYREAIEYMIAGHEAEAHAKAARKVA
jgi:hypothetical protein